MMALWIMLAGVCVFMLMFTLTNFTDTNRQLLAVLWFVMALLFAFEVLVTQRQSKPPKLTQTDRRNIYRDRISVKSLRRPRVTSTRPRPMIPTGRR